MRKLLFALLLLFALPEFSHAQGTGTGGGGTNATALQGIGITTGAPSSGQCLTFNGTQWTPGSCSGSSAFGFNQITSGTNTTAAMLVGTGGSLGVTGTGTIAATAIDGVTVSGAAANTNCLVASSSSAASWTACPGGGSSAFSSLTGGTNTAAAMILGTGSSLTVSGSGTNNATTLGGTTFAAPGPIGSGTASTGAFTTLSASSTVSGTGFSTYLASPPAIGGTSAAAGAFTTLGASSTVTFSGITGSTQCLHVSTAGVVSGTGSDCGSGGSTAFSGLTSGTNTAAAMVVGTGASLTVSGTGTVNANVLNGQTVPTLAASTGYLYDTAGTLSLSTSASNFTTGTLPHAQLPTLLSADIPNNAANTSGTAAGLSTTLIVGQGGTGLATLTANAIYKGNGTSAIATSCLSDNGTTLSCTAEPFAAGSSISTQADGTHPSSVQYVGNTTLPSLTANTVTELGPPAATFTAYSVQWPSAIPTTGHVLGCTVTGTNCLITDEGAPGTGTVGGTATVGFLPKMVTNTSTITSSLVDEGTTTTNVLTVADTAGLAVPNGIITSGTGPAITPGTAGGSAATEGTAFTGVATSDGWYASTANGCLDILNHTTDIGCGVGTTGTQTLTNKSLALTEINSGLTSGGVVCATSTTAISMTSAITANFFAKGGGAGVCPTNSLLSDSGTILTYSGTGGINLTGAGAGIGRYGNIATTGSGVAPQYATVDLTAQAAAITATTLYAVPATGAGQYRVCFDAKITTVDGTSAVLGGANGFQLVYTDKDDSVAVTTAAAVPFGSTTTLLAVNSTQTQENGCLFVNAKASTNIQYVFGYTGVGGQMRYNLHIKAEFLQ